MLRYAIGFFVIVIIAAVFAFGGIAIGIAYTAKIIFFISLPLFVLCSLLAAFIYKKEVLDKKDLHLILHHEEN